MENKSPLNSVQWAALYKGKRTASSVLTCTSGSICTDPWVKGIMHNRHRWWAGLQHSKGLRTVCPCRFSFCFQLSLVTWVMSDGWKYWRDNTKTFFSIKETEEFMHFSKMRMKTWLEPVLLWCSLETTTSVHGPQLIPSITFACRVRDNFCKVVVPFFS